MAFKLSINTMYDTISAYEKLFSDYETQIENCSNAVLSLADEGWKGKSGDEFYEKFLIWTQEAGVYFQKLSYLGKTLITLGALAEVLQAQYMSIPATVGAGGEISDIIYFEEKSLSAAHSAELFWQVVNRTLPALATECFEMRYRRLSLPEASTIAGEAKKAYNQIIAFCSVFHEYANNVKAFEDETPPKLEYAISKDFDYKTGNSLIGWDDEAGFALDLTKDAILPGLRTAFKVPKITQNGKYTYFSGFSKGKFSGRYLTSNIEAGAYKNATRAFKLDKGLNTAGKVLTYANWVLIAVSATVSGYEEYNRNPYLPESRKVFNTVDAVEYDLGISILALGGAGVGAKAGTAIGTMIFPGPGTVVGAIGGFFGGLIVGIGGEAIKNAAAERDRKRRYNELFGD